jgi:hypothetical protein
MSSGSGSWTRTWPSYSPTQSRGGGRFPRSRRWRTSRPWRPSSVPPTPRFRCSPRSPDSGRKSGCAREARHRQAGRSAARPPSVHRWAGEALRQAEPVAPGRPAARQGRARARRATTEGRHPLVFPAERGGHLNLHNWRRDHWKPAVRAAGLEHRTPYALRHTFASFAIAAGVSLFELARFMGTSVEQIDRTYGHLLPDALHRTWTALDSYLATRPQEAEAEEVP